MAKLIDVWTAHRQALSDVRNGRERRPHRTLKVVSLLAPVAAGVLAWFQDWNLDSVAGHLLAALAIATGVLIGVFAQLAAWRSRLDGRAASRGRSEAAARRAVDAAAYHTLAGILVSIAASVGAVLITGSAPGDRIWEAITVAASIYLVGVLLLIVGSLFTTYEANADPAVRAADKDRLTPEFADRG